MKVLPVDILNNFSLSNSIRIEGRQPIAIRMPTAWTAAALTFQASDDNTNWFDLYNSSGTEISVTAAASHVITLQSTPFADMWFWWLKIRSGTGAVPVNQAADRKLYLWLR